MTGSRKLLIFGGMALAAFGMLYGLQYALFIEHQTLDRMGGSLAQSFSAAASRNLGRSQAALEQYGETKYDYVRQVDAHSHWIGPGRRSLPLDRARHAHDRTGCNFRTGELQRGNSAVDWILLAGGQCAIPAGGHSPDVSSWCSDPKSSGRGWIRTGYRRIGGYSLGICTAT